MQNLKRFYFNPRFILPLVNKVLGFEFTDSELSKALMKGSYLINNEPPNQFEELSIVVKRLSEQYFNDLGHNAYAAFNVLTDLISNENSNVSKFGAFNNNPPSWYYKPTEWLYDFIEKIQNPDFDMEEYLSHYLKYVA